MPPKRQATYGGRRSTLNISSSPPPPSSSPPATPPVQPQTPPPVATALPTQIGAQSNAPPPLERPSKGQAAGGEQKPERHVPDLVTPDNLDVDKLHDVHHKAALDLFARYAKKRHDERKVLGVPHTPARAEMIIDNHDYIFPSTEQRVGAVAVNSFMNWTIDQVNEKSDALDGYARQNNALKRLEKFSAAEDDQVLTRQARRHIVGLTERMPGLLPALQAAGVEFELPAKEAVDEAKKALQDCMARGQTLRGELEALNSTMNEDEEEFNREKEELKQKLEESQILHSTAVDRLDETLQEIDDLRSGMLGSGEGGLDMAYVADLEQELANVRKELVDAGKDLKSALDELENEKLITEGDRENLELIDRVKKLVVEDGKVVVRTCNPDHPDTLRVMVHREDTNLHWVEALEHDIGLLMDLSLRTRRIRMARERSEKALQECKQHGTALDGEITKLKRQRANLYGVFDEIIIYASDMAQTVLKHAEEWDQRLSKGSIKRNSGPFYKSVDDLAALVLDKRVANEMNNDELSSGVSITMKALLKLLDRAMDIYMSEQKGHAADANVIRQWQDECDKLRNQCEREAAKLQSMETQHAGEISSQKQRHDAALALREKYIERLEAEIKRSLTQTIKDEKICNEDVKKLERQITELKIERDAVEVAKDTAEQAKNKRTTEKNQLAVELARVNQELIDLRPYKGRSESLTQELDAEKRTHEQCKNQVRKLEGDLAKEKSEHQTAKDTVAVLQAKTATAGEQQQKIADLERDLQQARQNLEDERKSRSAAKESLVKEKEVVERERDECRMNGMLITENVAKLEGELSGLRSELSNVREELDQKNHELDQQTQALVDERKQSEQDKNNLEGGLHEWKMRAERAEEHLQSTNESLVSMTAAKEEAVQKSGACSDSLRGWKIILLDRLLGHPVDQWLAFGNGIGDFGQVLTKQAEIEALNIVTVGKAENWLAVLSVPSVQANGEQACILNALQVWYGLVHPTESRFGHQELYGLAEGLRNASLKTICFCLAILEHAVYQQLNKELNSSSWSARLVTTWLRAIELLCTYYNGNVERLRPLAQNLSTISLIDSSKTPLVRGLLKLIADYFKSVIPPRHWLGLKLVEDAKEYDCSWNFGDIDIIPNGQDLLLVKDAATANRPVLVVARERYVLVNELFHLELRISDYPNAGETWVREIDLCEGGSSRAKVLLHFAGVLPRWT